MEKYTIRTILGSYDYEVITVGNQDYVATISRTNGSRYLKKSEIPKPVLQFLRNCNLKIALYNADKLNEQLGLCK